MGPETDGNWLKLYRKIIYHPVFHDPYLYKAFSYCLCRAGFKPKKFLFNGEEIELQAGQFISGRHEASNDLRFKSKMWDRKLRILENLGILTKQVTNKFTIISIINWDRYQNNGCEDDQVDDHQMTNKRPTNDQQMTTNKNEKNGKNGKKERNIFVIPTLEEVSLYCRERKNTVDPERWVDFYTSNGWMVGKNKMRDWKAAVRTWEKNETRNKPANKTLFEKNLEAGKRWLERTETENDPATKA